MLVLNHSGWNLLKAHVRQKNVQSPALWKGLDACACCNGCYSQHTWQANATSEEEGGKERGTAILIWLLPLVYRIQARHRT